MCKWWRHSIFSAGQLAKRVAIPTFFLDVVSEQVARPNRKKKEEEFYDCTAGKGVFGVSGVGFDYLFFFGGSTSLRSHFSICP